MVSFLSKSMFSSDSYEEWLDDEEKFNYEGLPPNDEFYSKLYQEKQSQKAHDSNLL